MNKTVRTIVSAGALALAACSNQHTGTPANNLTREEAEQVQYIQKIYSPVACNAVLDSLSAIIGRMPQARRISAAKGSDNQGNYWLEGKFYGDAADYLLKVNPQPASIRNYRSAMEVLHMHLQENAKFSYQGAQRYLTEQEKQHINVSECLGTSH